jgi:hypothetical protein
MAAAVATSTAAEVTRSAAHQATSVIASLLSSSVAASSSSLGSSGSSAGSWEAAVDLPSWLDDIYIAGWHVPEAAFIVFLVLMALLLVCVVVSVVCSGCLSCCHKTETAVGSGISSVKGFVRKRDLSKRQDKLAILKAKHRSDIMA